MVPEVLIIHTGKFSNIFGSTADTPFGTLLFFIGVALGLLVASNVFREEKEG